MRIHWPEFVRKFLKFTYQYGLPSYRESWLNSDPRSRPAELLGTTYVAQEGMRLIRPTN